MIRLVATDLDGTFWDASFVPPPSHVAVAGELMRAGVIIELDDRAQISAKDATAPTWDAVRLELLGR